MILKITILAILCYVIYRHLFQLNDIEELYRIFRTKFNGGNALLLILVILLMPLNWILETMKWKRLVEVYQELSFFNAMKGILSGVCLAVITPARIGEYGGRLVSIEKGNITKSFTSTFVGSMMQNGVNVFTGLFFLFLFQRRYELLTQHQISKLGMIIVVSVILVGVLIGVRKKVYQRIGILWNSERLNELKNVITDSLLVSKDIVTSVLSYSLLRYITYAAQYILLITFYGVTQDIVGSIMGVGVIFLFQTLIPLPPALSILARGEIAILVWSIFSENVIGILAATFSLWLINLMIPALVGYIIIWRTQLLK